MMLAIPPLTGAARMLATNQIHLLIEALIDVAVILSKRRNSQKMASRRL
jgi:hypothetical protein